MQARRLPAAHGVYWLFEGFRLFRRNPPFITALTLVYLLLVQGIAVLLPGIGPILLPLALPALTLIVANGCRLVDEGQRPAKDTLLRGLTGKGGKDGNSPAMLPMLKLGGLQLAGAILLVLLNTALGDGVDPFSGMENESIPAIVGMEGNAPAPAASDTPPPASEPAPDQEVKVAAHEAAVLNALLRLMLLATPLIIAFWFAPFLTGWDRVSPMKSLFFSIVASWRNWRALGMFSLGVVVLAGIVPGFILIAISQISGVALGTALVALRMILVFLVAPVLTASIYISYRDIFHASVDENA
jgi:hypothetical protein